MKQLFMLVVLAAGSMTVTAQTNYVVTDLGTLGGSQTSALSINNAGQVAGISHLTTGETRGYRTGPNSPINPATDVIGTLTGGTFSVAAGINSSGQVGGYADTAAGRDHAIRVDTDGSIHDLGFLGGAIDSSNGNAINDSGQVAGASDGPIPGFGPPCFGTGGLYAFRTSANSAMVPADNLGTLLGLCRYSVGFGINNAGQVVGDSAAGNVFNPEDHAMLATPASAMIDLGVLGGVVTFPAASGKRATANAINSSGQIVGTSTYNGAPAFYVTHAFLTTAAGPMADLGTIGGAWSSANAINTTGQIVGNSTTAGDAAGHAFLYTGGAMTDLNTMIAAGSGWELVNATSINDNGQIAGTGWLNGVKFVSHAVRLDPFDQAIPNLITSLSSPTLGLTSGQINSLTDKLNNALASIQAGLNKQAINQLNAFINSVQTDLKNGKISASAAASLTATANQIIALL
jgi:probable HAF family extracellular repeat protein